MLGQLQTGAPILRPARAPALVAAAAAALVAAAPIAPALGAEPEPLPAADPAPGPPTSVDTFRLMLGAAPHFSRDTAAIDLRLFVGWLHAWRPFGGGNTRPFVALGALGGSGVISVDDPRGLDGSVTVGRHHVGAEARLGLVRGEAERPVDLYLAVAGMRLFASRLSDRLPEAGGAFALRLAAGVALPGSWWARRQLSSCTDNSCIPVGLGLLLPNTLEITAELGSTFRRLGFALGYTF